MNNDLAPSGGVTKQSAACEEAQAKTETAGRGTTVSIYLSIYLSIYVCIYFSIYISTYLSIYLSG